MKYSSALLLSVSLMISNTASAQKIMGYIKTVKVDIANEMILFKVRNANKEINCKTAKYLIDTSSMIGEKAYQAVLDAQSNNKFVRIKSENNACGKTPVPVKSVLVGLTLEEEI